ncbi:DUF4230 domain-containing protein [Aurantiacibacter marinus]|uniref:DUF4230 domain-containing protein n=1 Tax=Aurantiacibacter marinus TaxID=874156 RepID=A0A0H0XP37_9SPHN|nr:DUF4230 domain-containing protein [Aurantiacibacter marinus]KLI64328.1 hypothetical protein AAV99_01445 [Aurantiacibacter marinus]
MDNQLKQDERSRMDVQTGPAAQGDLAVRRAGIAPWIIIALLAAALAWLAWEKWGPQDQGDIVATSLLAFEKQNSLTVFSSRFDVVAESTSTPSIGPLEIDALETRQAMIVPATVEYRLDLSAMDRDEFTWDAATQTLSVQLPGLTVSTPNLNEAQARYFTDGLYVSRDTSVSLSRSNSEVAERRARDFAENPEVMTLARTAARQAVQQNLAIPLQVAGFGDVQVTVRFADEE